jgi:opacity protein-like surface antigen
MQTTERNQAGFSNIYLSGTCKTKYTIKMNSAITSVAAIVMVASIFMVNAALCRAGEVESRFSLGYGSLTQAPADAKSPKSGLLTAQYGFGTAKEFKPYLGTGLSYSIQPESRPGDSTRIRAGLAGQAGFSYLLSGNSALKFDYKVLTITPDSVRDTGTPPQSLGVGLEIKF